MTKATTKKRKRNEKIILRSKSHSDNLPLSFVNPFYTEPEKFNSAAKCQEKPSLEIEPWEIVEAMVTVEYSPIEPRESLDTLFLHEECSVETDTYNMAQLAAMLVNFYSI